MILFALTSDIKQSTDYADLDSLLYGISNGDKKCLEQLYQVTHTSVYSFALSVLKNHHDAEDVLHDCYVAVWNGAESYVSRGKPMAWIITIAKNLCLQRMRERKKQDVHRRKAGNLLSRILICSQWRTEVFSSPAWNNCPMRNGR